MKMRNLIKILKQPGLKNLSRRLSQNSSQCDPKCPCPSAPTPTPCPKPPATCPPPRPLPVGSCQSVGVRSPCNYCPPPCPEPGYPVDSIVKIKKLQCFYQRDIHEDVYLANDTRDKFVFNVCTLGMFLSIISMVSIIFSFAAKY